MRRHIARKNSTLDPQIRWITQLMDRKKEMDQSRHETDVQWRRRKTEKEEYEISREESVDKKTDAVWKRRRTEKEGAFGLQMCWPWPWPSKTLWPWP